MDPWSNTTTDTGNYPYLSLSCHRSEVSVLLGSPLPVPGIKLNNIKIIREKREKITRWFEKKRNINKQSHTRRSDFFFLWPRFDESSVVLAPNSRHFRHQSAIFSISVERHIFVIDRIITIIIAIIIAYIIIESCCSLFNYLLRRWLIILWMNLHRQEIKK